MLPKEKNKWLPTRKWAVSTFGGFATIAAMFVRGDGWNDDLSYAVITLASTAFATYMIPNNPNNTNSP